MPVLDSTPALSTPVLSAAAPTGNSSTDTVCAGQTGHWCGWIHNVTGNSWLAQLGGTVLDPLIGIVIIAAIALITRILVHRLISRLSRRTGRGHLPAMLRPLADKRGHTQPGAPTSERRAQRAATIASLLKSVASFIIYGIAVVLALAKIGINVAPIIASAGVIGVAVGFGAQNLVKDFLSGIFMMLEDQYGVGDVIDTGTASGTVESVGLRVSTIRDSQGTLWYVRNGTITAVGNATQRYATAVVDIPVPLQRTQRALRVAGDAANAAIGDHNLADDVLGEVTVLGVQELTPDSVTIRVTVMTKPGRQYAVRRTLTAAILAELGTPESTTESTTASTTDGTTESGSGEATVDSPADDQATAGNR
ncbi:MAG TPA: mechanosensitive ion channel family protein [Pseudonocardiaceae bacterium]|nr:mechanosensitive ion channel family protein [Pseudonocardiaceae bacterium]